MTNSERQLPRPAREARLAIASHPSVPFPVFVAFASCRTSIGLSARQTALCVRARKGEPRSTKYKNHLEWPIGACLVPGVSDALTGVDRLLAIGAPALFTAAKSDGRTEPLPLFLSVSEADRPDDDPRLGGSILTEMAARAGVNIDEARSKTVRSGHAGFALALSLGVEALTKGTREVIVGGVDSYYHPDVLAWLDAERRIHGIGVENGFVPGEGAAFVVLSRETHSASSGAKGPGSKVIALNAVEVGVEPSVKTEAVNQALGLTALLRSLADLTGSPLPWVVTDVNGERHRLREWNLASMRGVVTENVVHDRLADELGDLGAASGAVFAAASAELIVVGAAPASHVGIALASDGEQRGSFLLGQQG